MVTGLAEAVTDESVPKAVALAEWYAAHSPVRRLWAIQEAQGMRVILMLEPTHDGDDVYPAWVAKGQKWAHELQLRLEGPVQLEVMEEPIFDNSLAPIDGALVAEIFWRDPSAPPD